MCCTSAIGPRSSSLFSRDCDVCRACCGVNRVCSVLWCRASPLHNVRAPAPSCPCCCCNCKHLLDRCPLATAALRHEVCSSGVPVRDGSGARCTSSGGPRRSICCTISSLFPKGAFHILIRYTVAASRSHLPIVVPAWLSTLSWWQLATGKAMRLVCSQTPWPRWHRTRHTSRRCVSGHVYALLGTNRYRQAYQLRPRSTVRESSGHVQVSGNDGGRG